MKTDAIIDSIERLDIIVQISPDDKGINAIQDSTRKIADSYIDEINRLFDTNAKFFQVFIHTSDKSNEALETSGIISGTGTISAVYTMPMEDTDSMYGKMSAMLLSKQIRESGGFYDISKKLANEENAKMSFTIIPTESKSNLQSVYKIWCCHTLIYDKLWKSWLG